MDMVDFAANMFVGYCYCSIFCPQTKDRYHKLTSRCELFNILFGYRYKFLLCIIPIIA